MPPPVRFIHLLARAPQTATEIPLDFGACSEADQYERCVCGAWVDLRDFAALLEHCRQLPHPEQGRQPH